MDQMIDARKNIAAALTTALDSNGYAAIVTGTGSINSGFSRDSVELRKTLDSTRTTTFAAEGPGFHNFDIIGTYSSLVDYASRMSRLPGRRLIVVFSPGFSSDLPEIRSAAAVSIDRIIQSGVVLNAINTEDSSSGSLINLCTRERVDKKSCDDAPPTIRPTLLKSVEYVCRNVCNPIAGGGE